MPYGDLLLIEYRRIYHQCYFSRWNPHYSTAVTSFSQLSCHSNEVWQTGQIVGKQNPDLCSLCACFSVSATISDRMTMDHATDPDFHDDGKTSLQCFFFLLFLEFCAWSLSKEARTPSTYI